jgi:5-deoxy-glucuronate isomerase
MVKKGGASMDGLMVRSKRPQSGNQPIVKVTPEKAGWTYVGFAVYRTVPGEAIDIREADRETAVIVLEGTCDVTVDGKTFASVGSRASVFDDVSPEAVYIPPNRPIRIVPRTRAEVAVATAASEGGEESARRITPKEIAVEERGEGNTRRYIRHILDEHHPAAKLLLVEVVTPPGNWSSFPPHKHDTEIPGKEAYLEETYYFRLNPPRGWAFQRVYDKEGLDQLLTPSDGDVVLVPKGYHPVVTPPGFTCYYLNVMAGHNRTWKYTIDEDFAHIAPKDGNIMGKVKR